MTFEAVSRLERAATELLAAIAMGECEPEPIETQALIYLLEKAGLMRLAIRYQRLYANITVRELMRATGGSH